MKIVNNLPKLREDDTANSIATYDSVDTIDVAEWTDVDVLESGEKHRSLFKKISTMFKNIRYIFKKLGTTDISAIGDGTVTGGISSLNENFVDISNDLIDTNNKFNNYHYLGVPTKVIKDGDDLDNYTTVGCYVKNSNTITVANEYANAPSTIYKLIVEATTNYNYLKQTMIFPYSNVVVERYRYWNSSINGWAWLDWVERAFKSQIDSVGMCDTLYFYHTASTSSTDKPPFTDQEITLANSLKNYRFLCISVGNGKSNSDIKLIPTNVINVGDIFRLPHIYYNDNGVLTLLEGVVEILSDYTKVKATVPSYTFLAIVGVR